ncbi:MAG: hypothetical protein PHS31_01635 [Victivallaceae bacterium]|nr:hypothetical protein [Victivallaceae bacterium]
MISRWKLCAMLAGKKIIFGLSLLHVTEEQNIPEVHDVFNAIELPGIFLNREYEKLQSLPQEVFFNDVLPIGLTREIALQDRRIQENFLTELALLLDRASNVGASGIVVDFEIESCFADTVRGNATDSLLKRLSADLLRTGLRLLLPIRFPFNPEAEGSSEKYLDCLKKMMSPQIGFVLNVYPHELAGRELDLKKLLHWIRFDTDLIRFIYEPETGNRLVPRLLKPWLQLVNDFELDVPLMAAPLFEQRETVEYELLILNDLFINLTTEQEKEYENAETWRKC